MPRDRSWTRRDFVRLGALLPAAAAAAAALDVAKLSAHGPAAVPALGADARRGGERALSFYNLHTDERLKTVYWSDGEYVPESLTEINHILRDFRTGTVKPIHTDLLDLLNRLSATLDTSKPFDIISGYRTPKTNAMLRHRSEGVAKNSLHMKAMAADIRVPGRRLKDVHDAAVRLRVGGVGYYPQSDFVHVDVGRVRYW